ncbi:MAG: site-specific integrase [Clostridiales bacterium]|nr:site-specific integrase [Clostridiales bacterium]
MPKKKRKKYPKLPSGFGTIRYLGSGRRNCYAVHPPAVIDALGHVQRPAALCYTDDWIKGFTILTAYKAGTYQPGMERELKISETNDADVLVQRIISDYSTIKGVEDKHPEIKEPTFAEVYEKFMHWKFEENKNVILSKASRNNYQVAFKNCKAIHNIIFSSLRHEELQKVVDDCPLKHSSVELIVTLFKQMYKYAIMYEICSENKAQYVSVNRPEDDEQGQPFTEEDLKTLWAHKEDEGAAMILIMCYSGFRISAYKTMTVNLEERYFQGGVKTAAGKNRIVPIHSAILPLVKTRMEKYGSLLPMSLTSFRKKYFDVILEELSLTGLPKHTPHDCRHTFSALCEKYSVRENDRKRMLGHSFGSDITNAKYGHRTLEELRREIEKIEVICD